MTIVNRTAYIGQLILIVAVISVTGCGSGPVAAPTAYQEYNVRDGTFACEYPDGWSADGGSGKGPVWATFKSGPAEIHISGDLAGSLVGDLAGVGVSNDEAQSPDDAPVHKVHEMGKEAAKKEYSGYVEVGSEQVLDARLGPARKSEFTASTAFGTGLHGYRVTVLGHDKRVVAYCVCPESDWATLQKPFDHVLSTLKRGMAE